MKTELHWLHLSDLHFSWRHAPAQEEAFEEIKKDITARQREGHLPDFIVFSGDLAFSGQRSQYNTVCGFLRDIQDLTGLDSSRFVFCPGNHDVDRNKHPLLFKGLRSVVCTPANIAPVWNTTEFRRLLERQKQFWNFVSDFYGDLQSVILDEHKLHYANTLSIDGIDIQFVSLNSSWTCGNDDDKDAIIVGHNQLLRFLDIIKFNESHLAVAVMHHPFDWLVQAESRRLEAELCSRFDFVMRGHIHQSDTKTVTIGSSAAYVLTAGAIFASRLSSRP